MMKIGGNVPAVLLLVISLCFCFSLWSGGQERLTPLSEIPVAVKGDEIGDMLRKWYSNGTAAGNTGDYYDNRDGGHSPLNMSPYPQLQKVEYTEEQIKARQNWGMQQRILPFVVFGNSSTSAAPEQGGSNVRSYYADPGGLPFLFAQYAANNLYIYPEHMDHDPGHNGIGGYGDLFPTNTPYLITSQGSSGSDQPFMQAMPYVLAAFHPEVKKKLVQSGLLMPTIQMILRITSRRLAGEKDYLTGKAHPTVFQGSDVDPKAMVEMAHGISASNIPPIAVIRVVKEDMPVGDVDYFEPGFTEKLADTPAVIARIFRGSGYSRKIVVSAENSRDLNNRPLRFHWAILRGDPNRIKIDYLNSSRSAAEITVPYHDRSPVADSPGLESNRVDIGVFVHNGTYYSPPAFITFFTLDNEARTYQTDGRILEIGYAAGTCQVSVARWDSLFDTLESRSECRPCDFLRKQFKAEEIASLLRVSEEFRKQHQILLEAQQILDRSAKNAPPAVEAARKAVDEAKQAEAQILQRKMPRLNIGAAELVQKGLDSMLRDPNLWSANADNIQMLYKSANNEARDAFNQIQRKLHTFGVADRAEGLSFRMEPLSGNLTRYEKNMIEQFNGTVLSRIIFPGIVESSWRENYVDHRLTSIKEWRDVYHYSPDGTLTGWRRYQPDGIMEFNAEGLAVVNKDPQGRCVRGRVVRYELELDKRNPNGRLKRVKMILTDTFREYRYDGANDWKGHIIN